MTAYAKYRIFWEQPVIDLWSIPHLLSGSIFFVLFRSFRVNPYLGLAANVAIAVLWEVFESNTGISASEYYTNHVGDVIFAQIGYLAALLFYGFYESEKARMRFFWAVTTVFGFFSLLGMTLHQIVHN